MTRAILYFPFLMILIFMFSTCTTQSDDNYFRDLMFDMRMESWQVTKPTPKYDAFLKEINKDQDKYYTLGSYHLQKKLAEVDKTIFKDSIGINCDFINNKHWSILEKDLSKLEAFRENSRKNALLRSKIDQIDFICIVLSGLANHTESQEQVFKSIEYFHANVERIHCPQLIRKFQQAYGGTIGYLRMNKIHNKDLIDYSLNLIRSKPKNANWISLMKNINYIITVKHSDKQVMSTLYMELEKQDFFKTPANKKIYTKYIEQYKTDE